MRGGRPGVKRRRPAYSNALLGARMSDCHHAHDRGRHDGHPPAHDTEAGTVEDPVCGMTVDPATAEHHAVHRGPTYWFCSARCRERFEAEPDRWLPPRLEPAASGGQGVRHVCPLCEGVEQARPGTCPNYGIARGPRTPPN